MSERSPTVEAPRTGGTGSSARMAGVRRPGFAAALRSEWVKLASLRSTWLTLAVTALLAVGFGALASALGSTHRGHGRLVVWDPTALSLSGFSFAQLSVAVLGALVVTGEYSTRSVTTSVIAHPHRARLFAAKTAVYAAVAAVTGEVLSFAAFFVGQALIAGHAPTAALSEAGVGRAVAGGGLYLAVVAVLAVAFGFLTRSTFASVSSLVALVFVLPSVAVALPSSWRNPILKFWPTQAGSQVMAVARQPHTLAPWAGFAALVGFVVVVCAAALWRFCRRDV
jgi:ABC-2 type transport system permease protein